MKKIGSVLLLLLMSCSCNQDNNEISLKIINEVTNNLQLQEELYGYSVYLRSNSSDTFIYVVDSLKTGFYLTNYSLNHADELQLSEDIIKDIEKLLKDNKGLELAAIEKNLYKHAHFIISKMIELGCISINGIDKWNEQKVISFQISSEDFLVFSHEKTKLNLKEVAEYGEYKILNEHWTIYKRKNAK